MHRVLAVAFVLVALVHPVATPAQEAASARAFHPDVASPTFAGVPAEHFSARAATRVLPDPSVAPPRVEAERLRAVQAPSLSRHLKIGGGIGAVVGAAFGMWVISIADCGGSNCTAQRVVGVAGNALGGAAIGALLGGAVYLIRR